MKIYEPICFQNAAVSPIDLRPFEVEKQEVNSAEVLAATLTVLAVLSELEIISLGGKSKECFYTQKCVNHGPRHEKSISLSTPCEDPPFDNGEHHVIVLSESGSVDQF